MKRNYSDLRESLYWQALQIRAGNYPSIVWEPYRGEEE